MDKNDEVAALEALRDSSADLVKYLETINSKLTQLNQQNERTCVSPSLGGAADSCMSLCPVSLRVLENWSSVIAIASATKSSSSAGSKRLMELERNRAE